MLNHLPKFQKGWGLDRTLIFRGGLVEKRRGGLQFAYEKKLKCEIFNNQKKKKIKQKSSCHNYEFKLVNFNLEFIAFKM